LASDVRVINDECVFNGKGFIIGQWHAGWSSIAPAVSRDAVSDLHLTERLQHSSMLSLSVASSFQQVATLLCELENSTSYSQWDGKW